MSLESQNALVKQYCQGCHNDNLKSGGMTLTSLDLGHADRNPELAEKMIRKLRAGLMPPSGSRRPDAATLKNFAASLEAEIDQAAHLYSGSRPFQRLTRTEYARSIRDLLGIDVDVTEFLPPDTISDGFDNVADTQMVSAAATLMEGYMRAADEISRAAVGDPNASPTSATYRPPRTGSQMHHVDGTPIGTRGGIAVEHNFPADGEYSFRALLYGTLTGDLYGAVLPGEGLEISINSERVALLKINPLMKEADSRGLNIESDRIFVRAGPQKVAAAFPETFSGLADDLLAPVEHTLADIHQRSKREITARTHLRDLVISGPFKVTGVSETPSRRRIFTCRPTSLSEELSCAKQIVSNLATKAFRTPVTEQHIEGPMSFYEQGRAEGDFESGIRTALQAILASPRFVFRFESSPRGVLPGQTYKLSGLDLASRLSYFLWATLPDEELLNVARRGKLQDPAELERQVRRMLADPRAESLSTKFAAQWLRLPDLAHLQPDFLIYPIYDATLAEALRRETELFFNSIVREDRSIFDLLNADYTFVNGRLAKHYGFPNIVGNAFQRVTWNDENRRGLLGQGSILTLTSNADRTSPVKRGKWVLEVLLGTPPPPPPPNVPDLEQTQAVGEGRLLSVAERMALHRANAACRSCHSVIDPIGLALENFDATGQWRIRDGATLIDPSSELFDGTKLAGPPSLRQAIQNYSEAYVHTLTENLMTYGLGRRVEYHDMPLVRAVAREAKANDYRFSSFILAIVKSPAFQMNRVVERTNY